MTAYQLYYIKQLALHRGRNEEAHHNFTSGSYDSPTLKFDMALMGPLADDSHNLDISSAGKIYLMGLLGCGAC